jgi:predicted glutamine amidotransferase
MCELLGVSATHPQSLLRCYGDAEDDTGLQRLSQLAGSIAQLGKFNFLLSDGAFLIAYGHDRLHYLESPAVGALSLVATEPLTAEPWRPFARGELRVYERGALALRVIAAPAQPEAPAAEVRAAETSAA